ncbi:hypothetical protein FKW77_009676 [Venturia effusa]|uniref:Glycosyltransferase family 1 protein n=1 Tax=Venturia effusa TaxID=50376 RepID=A0A517L487_9PEZI|nr:hypothetical protein FKW77_009676 [Venturia effusa]
MLAFARRLLLLAGFAAFVLLSTFFFLQRREAGLISVSGVGNWDAAVASEGRGKKEEDQSSAEAGAGNVVAPLAESGNGNGQDEAFFEAMLKPSPRKQLRVAVVESGGQNEEVTAALVYAFGRQALSPVSLYLLEQRFQMGEIIREFDLPTPIAANKSSLDFAAAVDGPGFPELLVSSSCEIDIVRLHDSFEKLLKGGKTYLYCVIHDADAWKEGDLVNKIRPWVQQQMIDLVTLSTHTAHHLRTQAIANWDFNATVTVQWLPPIFPVDIPKQPDEIAIQASSNFPFAIFTDADPGENNYTDIFSSLVAVLEQAKNITNDVDTQRSRNVQLHLLGRHPAPKIPSSLKQHVVYKPTQSYKDYYTQLSQAFALIPYLPLPTYLTSRASSAIPAALIAGAPLVASPELLAAYSYVPQDAVWMSTVGEGGMDTARRLVQWSAPEHWKKKQIAKKRSEELLGTIEELVGGWVGQAQRKIERAGWRMKGTVDL